MTLPPSASGSPTGAAPAADGADPSMEEILASIRRILNEDDAPSAQDEAAPADDDVLVLDQSMLVSVPEPEKHQREADHVVATRPDTGQSKDSSREAIHHEAAAPEVIPPEAVRFHPDDGEVGKARTKDQPSWDQESDEEEETPLPADEPAEEHSKVVVDPFDEPFTPPVPTIASAPATHMTESLEPSHPESGHLEPTQFFGQTLVAPATAAATASSVDGLLRTLAASRATQVYRGGPTVEDLVREELRPLLKGWLDQNLPPLVERLVRAEIERVVGRTVP